MQDKIQLVPIDLENRPAWYKEKVYSANKVKLYKCKLSSVIWVLHENILLHLSSLAIKSTYSTSRMEWKMKEESLINIDNFVDNAIS